jgi:hypothetical protein
VKLLLDHCVDRRLADAIEGHDVATAADRGLEQLKNGELLAAASALGFDALVTIDRNMRHQQNLDKLPLTVIELSGPETRLASLLGHVAHLEKAISMVSLLRFISIDAQGQVELLSKKVE